MFLKEMRARNGISDRELNLVQNNESEMCFWVGYSSAFHEGYLKGKEEGEKRLEWYLDGKCTPLF